MPERDSVIALASVGGVARSRIEPRQLPHNAEAEQGLLGALLIDNRLVEKVSEFLKPEHFYLPAHTRIYEAITKLVERGQLATPVTLKAIFEGDPDLGQQGGGIYLADLAASVVTIFDVADYGRTIFDLYLRRQLISLGEDIVNNAHEHDLDVAASDQIETAERRLFDLGTTGGSGSGFVAFSTSLAQAINTAEAAYRRESHVTGVTTGLVDLNRKLGGLQKSDLIILAGRPSMGKTALATNIAFNAAQAWQDSKGKEGGMVAFFSLEMSAEQLATRILSEVSEVPSEKIRKGEVRDVEFRRFVEASRKMASVPLYIDDTPALSIAQVRTRARRLSRQSGLGMIVIDYLQLLRGSSTGRAAESRVLEISEITRGLKAIAKELAVPVLALSQLSRAVEQREDKRPQLSDLRESGSIEQDADVVMFVFREEYYIERDIPTMLKDESQDKFNDRYARWQDRLKNAHQIAEVIIGKQRHGPIGTVKLHFDGQFTRFSDLDSHHQLD
ncbi:MAG TPA: replicative DNA helicase [Alphaproteobacteria bacterium]|nr:replicative DNA helicase [Alphaproteobacteria bacterium]